MGIEEYLLDRAEKRGIEIGRAEGKAEGRLETSYEKETLFVQGLLQGTDFDPEKIASLASVSVEFVEKIRRSLK
jgi:hypothetical protein